MPEILLAIVDNHTGDLLLDTSNNAIAAAMQGDLASQLGESDGLGCALPQPNTIRQLPWATSDNTIRIGGYWHDSVIEGPGRRSVVRMQGCPIHCPGCWVRETWDAMGGREADVDALADALLEDGHERSGVTILGGEPFAQPTALAELVWELRAREMDVHILVYTGFTLENLRHRGDAHIDYVLGAIDTLIDGPYIARLAEGAGPWTGSSNQRVIDLAAERSC